jgi:hypothetical protein
MTYHRLFWDFYGPAAAGTAAHHRRHLDEFLAALTIEGETGVETLTPNHVCAWCRVPAEHGRTVHERLRSHRAVEEVR